MRTQGKPDPVRNLVFTVGVTCASRLLILRERLRRTIPAAPQPLQTRFIVYRIASGRNLLDAALVEPFDRSAKVGMLICHGIGETVAHWQAAQVLLAQAGVASLVFNYSGYGRSTGHTDAKQCEADAKCAFMFLQALLPEVPLSLLGYSMGCGIATAIAPRVQACHLVLCAAFTSLRKAARSAGVPGWLTTLLPELWNNEARLQLCSTPVLLVHGEEDKLFPTTMAQSLASACAAPCELILVPGLTHNAPIFDAQADYWSRIAKALISSTHVQTSQVQRPENSFAC